jgi:hypothetical protein
MVEPPLCGWAIGGSGSDWLIGSFRAGVFTPSPLYSGEMGMNESPLL